MKRAKGNPRAASTYRGARRNSEDRKQAISIARIGRRRRWANLNLPAGRKAVA